MKHFCANCGEPAPSTQSRRLYPYGPNYLDVRPLNDAREPVPADLCLADLLILAAASAARSRSSGRRCAPLHAPGR